MTSTIANVVRKTCPHDLQFRLSQRAKRAGLSVSSARFIAQFRLCYWSLTELLQLTKAEVLTRRRRFSIYLPRLFCRKTC